MSKIQSNSFKKLNQNEFVDKLDKLEKGLQTGKMWMNDRCEIQSKDSRLIRILKSIISAILPFKLYSSIKVDRVASNFFDFLKINEEQFTQNLNLGKAYAIINELDKTTHNKYHDKLDKLHDAITKMHFSSNSLPVNLARENAELEETQRKLEELRNAPTENPSQSNFDFEKYLNSLPDSERYVPYEDEQ